jgi:hypothetical protein
MAAMKELFTTANTDPFIKGYIDAALWSSTDESTPQGGEPLDANYSIEDIAPETLQRMIADCQRFQQENAKLLAAAIRIYPRKVGDPTAYAGHDFWLTRNGHGAGYWDGDLPDAIGEPLTDAAHKMGEFNICVGDDGKIYA